MNDCPESGRLGAYHDGELSAAERARLDGHLRGCPACAAELGRLERLSGLIRSGRRAAVPASAFARMHRSADLAPRLAVLHLAETFAAVAAAVLLVSLIWLFELSTTREASAQGPAWETVATASLDTSSSVQDPSVQWIDEVLSGKSGQ